MSCNTNHNCRNTYFNYGSYLRSRGYDTAICKLLNDIKSGIIPIGPITPHDCGVIIDGNLLIQPCLTKPNSGRLRVRGGTVGTCGTPAQQLLNSELYGITTDNGLNVRGPIFAQALQDCSNNTFIAQQSSFIGDITGSATNKHNLIVSGDIDCLNKATIGTAITSSGSEILTCGPTIGTTNLTVTHQNGTSNDTILNVNDNFQVKRTNIISSVTDEILNVNDNFKVLNASSATNTILNVNDNFKILNALNINNGILSIDDKFYVNKTFTMVGGGGDENPILRINNNVFVYNSNGSVSGANKKIFEVSGDNLGASSTRRFTIKENDATSNLDIYMLGLPLSLDLLPNNVVVDTNGKLWQRPDGVSSRRYKDNIKNLELEEARKVLNLKGKTFNYKKTTKTVNGFIAEEAHELGLSEFVTYDASNQPDGFRYADMCVPLLEIIKDQDKRITSLESRIIALEKSS